MSLLDISSIRYDDMNPPGQSFVFFGGHEYSWGASDDRQSLARMDLGRRWRAWRERVAVLEGGGTHEIREQIAEATELVERWIDRPGVYDYDIPPTIPEAKQIATASLSKLRGAILLLGQQGEGGFHLVPDTSALIRQPDLSTYGNAVGLDAVLIHLVPTVLGEIDMLKDQGRTPEVREKAGALTRRIKGLRDRGRLTAGVVVAGAVRAIADTREPDFKHLPDWLSNSTPDDRVLAAALGLQGANPSGVVVLVATDINIQNKAEACGLPYVEPADS